MLLHADGHGRHCVSGAIKDCSLVLHIAYLMIRLYSDEFSVHGARLTRLP